MSHHVVFVASVFPCLSETFLFDQFEILREKGLAMDVASNNRPAEGEVHPHMRDAQSRVVYLCDVSKGEMLKAHGRTLLRHPLRYLYSLARIPFMQEKWKTSLKQLSGSALLLMRYPDSRFHAHFTYGAAAVAMWVGRLSGKPFSLTLHGADLIYDYSPDIGQKLGEADGLVSISQFNVDYLAQHHPQVAPSRVKVIPLGIKRWFAEPTPRKPSPVFRILNVGRLSEHKAQHLLIDACAILAQRGYNFICDIAGEGPKRALLEERIAQHNLQDKVRLLGARYHDQVLALYAEYDLFALCSVTEGMPVVIMEAMQAGLPVLAPALSAIPEQLGEAGYLFPAGDSQALAEKLIEALEKTEAERKTLVAAAFARVLERFDIEANTLRFKAFLERRID